MRAGRAHGDGKEVVVPCLTLDELELGRLDLIKVDTHTCSCQVLEIGGSIYQVVELKINMS